MVPNALQASVCDEQLVSIGGEIALSGNKKKQKKKKKTKNKKAWGGPRTEVSWGSAGREGGGGRKGEEAWSAKRVMTAVCVSQQERIRLSSHVLGTTECVF